MDRRRAAGVLLALAASVAYATAAPTASNHTSLDIYDGAPDGCYYNFQHYGEGDRIMTNEPCLNCTCHNRMLMCYLRVCPFTKPIGQDCTIEKRADQCCPIVTCPDVPVDLLTSTTTSPAEYGATGLGKLDKYGCSIHGKYFPEGSKVPPTPNKPCEHCYCIRNMTTCVMQECTLHVDGCTPIYHKDVCCPVRYSCDHPEDEMPLLDDLSTTVRPTPGFLLTTTTLSPVTQMSQECLYDNQIISDGALIKTEKACDHCYCMKGDIVCVVQECGTPMENEGKNCTALPPREGVCCPDTYICEGDEPTTGSYEADYTTELEKLTTLSPPRRTGSEGSGYRNEPDSISSTELPRFEAESEGSGYDQATIHPTVITDASPESHKTEFSNEIASSTVVTYDITTTTKPVSYDADVTTKIDLQKDTESQQYLPSTLAQEEELGSGEEEMVTSYEIASTSSTLPAIIANEPTTASKLNIGTSESNTETHVQEPTTSASVIDNDQTNFDMSTDDSTIEMTTETRRHLDEDGGIEESTIFDDGYQLTEHDSLRTTTAPIIESKSTASPEQHHPTASISVPGFEDEIATEVIDVVTDSTEGTGSDFDFHHQISMTASTPLLEEIEKEPTEQENVPGVSSPDKFKTSTTLLNLPTEETIYKESLKPDSIDEAISSNLPTTVFAYENDAITTADPQKLHETGFEDSSESQQDAHSTSAPVFEDKNEETTPSDTLSTSKTQESKKPDAGESSEPQQNIFTTRSPVFDDEITPADTVSATKTQDSQETYVEESSEPQQNAPTTNANVFEDEAKKTTLPDSRTTSKTQETDVDESSEPQQNSPTTSAPLFEDEINKITLSDTISTSKTPEIDVYGSSESEQYAPFTSAPIYDDETKKITLSDSRTTSRTDEVQGTESNESSEPQQSVTTSSSPVYDDETKETTLSDSTTTSKIQEEQEMDVDKNLEPQQNTPTTNAAVFVDENKETTPAVTMTTSKSQESHETDLDASSESQQDAPTTSAPRFENEIKEKLPADTMTTSKTQESQETHIAESSEPQQNAPTTSAPSYDDETKKATHTDSLTPSKTEEGQETDIDESSETQHDVPTTNVPMFVDEIKEITPTDTVTTQESQEMSVDDSSDSQQKVSITTAPVYDNEAKITTVSDFMATSKVQESQETDVYEHSEPQHETRKTTPSDSMATSEIQDVKESPETQEYTPTPSTPVFDYVTKKTTPQDSLTTPEAEKHDVEEDSEPQHLVPTTTYGDDIIKTSSETIFEANEITTAEPDKGLNTIPSGSLEEETTESAGIGTYTHGDELIHTESATELDDKYISEKDLPKLTTSMPDTSASQEDQFTLTTKPVEEESINKIDSTEKYDFTKLTTIPAEISSETYYDHVSSTKTPSSESQESTTSLGPLNTENVKETTDSQKPIATSSYETSSQATGPEDSIPEKHEDITSPPSYVTVPASTIADLEENEIINEPRIPGEGDCLLNGVTYRNESAVPSINKCQSGCRCSSSIIKCDPIICSSPPEYMDNCQATYDSLDSCCPTYVCDHKTETMPPQSHSQMSGTEAPVQSPVICNGDECVLSEDKNQFVETSEPCKSGSCTSQDETVQVNIPEQTALDHHEKCTGSKCTSSVPTDQLCSEENGCQAVPVKPCEGTDCEVTSEVISPQKQPCSGDHCDTPIKDCTGGKCDSDGENNLGIETECTEKSCSKRKDGSGLEQIPPKECLGPDCPSTAVVSGVDLTTTDNIDTATEKTSEQSSIQTDHSTRPVEDITEEPGEPGTLQTDIVSQPLSTTSHPDIMTTISDVGSESDKISPIYESVTQKETPITDLPDSTQVFDSKVTTEAAISLSDVTDRLENDVTTKTEHTESPDVSHEKELTTEILEKTSTLPPITYTTNEQQVTKLPQETDDQEKTTLVSNENETEPNIIPVTEKLVTQLPEKDIPKDTVTSSLEDMLTEPPIISELDNDSHDVTLQEVTISPMHMNDDVTAKTSVIYEMEEVTKSPQVDDVKVTMNNFDEDIGSTTLKTYDTNTQETTISPKEPQSEETTGKSTDEFINKPETDIEKTSTSPGGTSSDELTKHDLEEPSSETTMYLEKEVTQSPEKTSEITTTPTAEDVKTETIGSFEMNAQEVTKPSEDTENEVITSRITEESVTETSKPHDTELQKVTSSSDQTEGEDARKKLPVTEPSVDAVTEDQEATKSPGAIEFTTVNVIAETDTDSSKYDNTLHDITVPQLDTVTDVSVSKVKDESGTESSKSDESEPLGITESLDDNQETTAKVTKEVYTEPTTQSSISESDLLTDVTTTRPEDESKLSSESLSLEKSTTLQPNTVSETSTQSISVPDSISTETEKPGFTELSTRIQPTEKVVESATESIAKTTTISSESPIHKESDVTTITDRNILTESELDLVTKPLLEETTSSDKTSKDSDITDTTMDTSEKTVTESLKEQNTEVPDVAQKTTEENVEVNEITQKPPSGYEENTKTEVPFILETKKDTIPEQTTSKPSVTTDALYSVDLKTEQPETISYPKEELEKTTKEPSIAETVTVEPSKIDTSETNTPFNDEFITKTTSTEPEKLSDNVTEMVNESVTIQYQDKPTEEETHTKLPMHSYSEAVDLDTPSHDDGNELTTPTIRISEVTEPNTVLYIPTTSSGSQNLDTYTGKPSETPEGSSETEVTELSKVESSTSKDEAADKETQTMTPEISIDKESSTDDQLITDMHKLSTVSSQETYAEPLEENITTAKPVITETERINELVTESAETIATSTETKNPEKEALKPSQPTATESVEITKEHDQGVSENVLITTDTMVTKDYDSTTTSTPMIKPTKTPETMETSSELLELITNPAAMETSTLKHDLSEATTSGKIDDENLSPVDKESTIIPVTVSDQQTVEVSTESLPVLIDTATKKPIIELMEDELMPSKTEMPEMYHTTLSTATESAKSTQLPKEETLTTSDETLPLTSIEHHMAEGAQSAATVVSTQDMATTPKPAEIEVQTEKATTPTETPLQPESSPVTSAQEEEKLTTAKAEEISTASSVSDKVTKPSHATTETPVAEQPRPIPTEDQSLDDIMTPDEEPSIPPSGTSGYGTDPDYMEEDQTFGPGTCRYGGKVYVSAQQIPRDDPCDFCFCFRSDIICLQQSCPPPIHGCHEEPISGFCCPRYECPVSMATTVNVTTTTTTTTTTLPPHFPVHSYKGSAQKRGCLIKGHTYKVGEVVRASSGPCLHCTCGGDGQMKCDPKQCTPEPMLRQMIAAAVSAKRRR